MRKLLSSRVKRGVLIKEVQNKRSQSTGCYFDNKEVSGFLNRWLHCTEVKKNSFKLFGSEYKLDINIDAISNSQLLKNPDHLINGFLESIYEIMDINNDPNLYYKATVFAAALSGGFKKVSSDQYKNITPGAGIGVPIMFTRKTTYDERLHRTESYGLDRSSPTTVEGLTPQSLN